MIGAAGAALVVALAVPLGGGVSHLPSDDPNRSATIDALKPGAWVASISRLDSSVVKLDANVKGLEANVSPLELESTDGAETVISLTSDVLFAFGKATLADGAAEWIAALVKPIPNGATVKVYGHTDGKGTAKANQTLSEQRAKAVAAVIATTQPGLKLDVQGFGMTKPVEPNTKGGEDNPEGREKNRRVEVRYEK